MNLPPIELPASFGVFCPELDKRGEHPIVTATLTNIYYRCDACAGVAHNASDAPCELVNYPRAASVVNELRIIYRMRPLLIDQFHARCVWTADCTFGAAGTLQNTDWDDIPCCTKCAARYLNQ